MPIIELNETENSVAKAVTITENNVLIPILYKKGTVASIIRPKKYTKLAEFVKDYSSHAVNVKETEESVVHKDRSYTMACELLSAGLGVIAKPIEAVKDDDYTVDEVIAALETAIADESALEEFKNKNLYNIKFVTAGAYPTSGRKSHEGELYFRLGDKLVDLAKTREDAVAVLDFRDGFNSDEELLTELADLNPGDDYQYSTTMFPWGKATVSETIIDGEAEKTVKKVVTLPGSFAYLKAFANSVKSNAPWFAVAGMQRGYIPDFVAPTYEVGESLMHILQHEANWSRPTNRFTKNVITNPLNLRVNTIMDLGDKVYRIWGNATTKVIATEGEQKYYKEFLNVRMMLCDLFKILYYDALLTMFEPDDDITWLTFKSRVNTGYLEKAKSGRGVEWYKWTKEQPEDKAELVASLEVKPIEGIDAIKVNTILTGDEISVAEE